MAKLLLTAVIWGWAQLAGATIILHDKDDFLALVQHPFKGIGFSVLKDGTPYTQSALSSPLVVSSSYPLSVEVRSYGWSDDLEILSTVLNCGCAYTATQWNGSEIAPTFYPRIAIDTGRQSLAVGVETDQGFWGFIPESDQDTFYLLPAFATVSYIEYGAVQPFVVPEPPLYTLIGLGSLIMAWNTRRPKTTVVISP